MKLEALHVIWFFIISNLVVFSQSKNNRLPTNAKPRNYKLFLNPDLTSESESFEGEVIIELDVLNITENLTLHSSNLTINQIHTFVKNESIQIRPLNHTWNEDNEFLTLNFANDLYPGRYDLNLKYQGHLNDQGEGFFKDSYVDDKNQTIFFAATHLEPTFARQVFPCWDEPALKAKFEISMKHYPNYTALSNMPMIETMKQPLEDGKIWTKFKETPLLSIYSLAFTISDFENITNVHGNFSIWTRRNAMGNKTFGYNVGQMALKVLENYTGIPYSLPKMDVFILPNYNSPTLGWGLVLINEETFLKGEGISKELLAKRGKNICHEIIHQWLGSLVSPAWWSDLWVTEGLTNYLEYFILNKIKSDEISSLSKYQSLYSRMWRLLHAEEDLDSSILYRNISIIATNDYRKSIIIHIKPPILFNMLSNIISEHVFHKGVKNVLKEYQFSSITTDQFLEKMQEVVNESRDLKLYDSFDVKAFMRPYISQRGYPVVTVSRDKSTGIIKLTQECLVCSNNNSEKTKWPIPITFATQSSPDFSIPRPIHWLKPSMNELNINNVSSNDWIIFNVQASGHYRVNYDNETWQQISDYLNSENFTKIHVMNRLKLLMDASWFFMKGKLSRNAYYHFLSYCQREREDIIWNNLPDYIIRIMLYVDEDILDFYTNLVNSASEDIVKVGKVDEKSFTFQSGIHFIRKCYNSSESWCKAVFKP